MKTLQTILMLSTVALLAVTLLAAPVLAQCPDATGIWSTQMGTMLGGRASEAFCGLDGNPLYGGQEGNSQNAMSWDGTTLGSQWKAWGMAIDASGAVEIGNTVDPVTGNGTITYQTFYLGGQFWLNGGHTWGDGINDLTGTITDYQVITTVTVVGNSAVGATSNITFGGLFENCPAFQDCRVEFVLSNAILIWSSHWGTPMPPDYPGFMCDANVGELFDVCCTTMSIDCAVATESQTWSGIKAMYR